MVKRKFKVGDMVKPNKKADENYTITTTLILSILVDTFISKISFPMQPGPEIGSISDA